MSLVGKPFWAGLGLANPAEQADFVAEAKLRAKRYFDAADQLGLIEQWRAADAVYFMRDREGGLGTQMATKLDLGTRKDPGVKIRIPEVRSLLRQQLAFLMAEKTSFQCVASMGETRSVVSAELADKAVNYVYDEHIRPTVRKFAERVLVFGAGATHLRWDVTRGDDVTEQVPVEQPTPMQQPDGSVVVVPQTVMAKRQAKSGAPFVDALTPLQFAMDPLTGIKAGWVIAFERTNLYALAAEYPDRAQDLLDVSTTDEFQAYRLTNWSDSLGANDGDIMAMHFYYADRPELRGGRYALIVGDKVVLDVPRCPLKAGRLPVRPLLLSEMSESSFSFADGWGLQAIEESMNRIRSSRLTNIAYHGNQVLTQVEGTTTVAEQLSGATRVKTYPRDANPPAAMAVAPMPPDAAALTEELVATITRVGGFSDVSRGSSSVEKTTSGAHAAVFEAITARNLSLAQSDLVAHEEALANDLIEMLRSYANTGFVAEIAGREGAPIAKLFAPDDLSSVRRVRAKAVPDAMRGPLARLQLLEQTKDIQDPKERAKAVHMVLRGDDEWGKAETRQIDRIKSENERLISGEGTVTAAVSDDHVADMFEHRGALDLLRMQDDPDPEAITRITTHMMEHVELVQQQDPIMARLLGYPDPPILPGNPAFVFQQSMQQAQMMLGGGMPGAPGAPPPDGQGGPANDQQQQPAPEQGAQPEAAA